MSFHEHERFQVHCRWCQKTHEADTAEGAVALVQEHEGECPRRPKEKS